jgi:hypothetical protein
MGLKLAYTEVSPANLVQLQGLLVLFLSWISLCSQAGLQLTVLLPPPAECWDHRGVPPHLASNAGSDAVMGVGPENLTGFCCPQANFTLRRETLFFLFIYFSVSLSNLFYCFYI